MAHAGEEGPPAYITEALELLQVKRIDHGVRCLEDDQVVQVLRDRAIPLTVCPLSNLKLCVVDHLSKHPLKTLLQRGLVVTVNSDDPAYFGGYVAENFQACYENLQLTSDEIFALAKNSFLASFLTEEERAGFLAELDAFFRTHSLTATTTPIDS